MDDQSHIFQLLFQEQIDEYKQSLSSIDDLFEQKEQQQQKEHPITITVRIHSKFESLNLVWTYFRSLSITYTKKKISWLQIHLQRIAHRLVRRLQSPVLSLMSKWKKKSHLNQLSVCFIAHLFHKSLY